MEVSTDYFISLVECNRIIYDKSSKEFKNAVKKDEAWVRIAKNSRMTVEEAKKRYLSLRQKYCREKHKIEVQRRTKSRPLKPWIYHDRLHFLNDFIHPRTTYTNDTGFEDIDSNSSHPADDASMSLAEEHALINQIEIEAEGFHNEESVDVNDDGVGLNDRIVRYNREDVQDHNLIRIVDSSENLYTSILSEYSGELSTFTPSTVPFAIPNDESENSVRAIDTNSSCTILEGTRNLSRPSRDDGDNILQTQKNSATNSPRRMAIVASNVPSSSRDDNFSGTRKNLPPTKSTPATKSKAHHTMPASVIHKTVDPPATTTITSISSNEKNMESVRHKLDSCLTSLSTKISEKQQRSPHAPFLAYLATKLPNVPIEDLPTLEKRILGLVDSFSQ